MAEDQVKAAAGAQSLDARILIALQTPPETSIPAGFAARVAGQLPSRPSVVLAPRRNGLIAALASLVLLMAFMLSFAHRATGNPLYLLSIESILCLQFVLLSIWIVARSAGYTLPGRS